MTGGDGFLIAALILFYSFMAAQLFVPWSAHLFSDDSGNRGAFSFQRPQVIQKIWGVISTTLNNPLKSKSTNPVEQTMLDALSAATSGQTVVFRKERLTDLTSACDIPAEYASHYSGARKGQMMGFVVCDKTTLEVLCAIELYDLVGGQKIDGAASALAAKACTSANIPLLTIKANDKYGVAEMTALVQPYLAPLIPLAA